MKPIHKTKEGGQAIVLIAVALVVLLGFTALAVDGSMLYSDRRHAQNGADAASLAGGAAAALSLENNHVYYRAWNNCGNANISTAITAANNASASRAQDNDYTIDLDLAYDLPTDNGYVSGQCGVDSTPYFEDRYIDIEVGITRDTRTAFAHFVFGGPLRTSVTAVTRVRPRAPLAFGQAIVALNPGPCNTGGLQFGGNLELDTTGGGFFSNGCLDVDGNPDIDLFDGEVAYFIQGDSLDQIEIYDAGGNFLGYATSNDLGNLLSDAGDQIPRDNYDIPVPDCTGHTISATSLSGQSGLSGLYCVTGDLTINSTAESISGTDLTFVFLGGKLTINGGDNSIVAPPADYTGTAIPGILIYFPYSIYGPVCGDVNQEIKLNGNGFNEFRGTVLAPCSDISIEGSTGTFAYESQIIGWNVTSSGTADINVEYDDAEQYTKPTNLELYR